MVQYARVPCQSGDGHEWTVIPETSHGPGVPVYSTEIESECSKLQQRFTEEPIFLQVINTFLNLDTGKTVQEKRRARHRALGYQIDGGKLWQLGDGCSTRSCPWLECVSQKEAVELARVEHATNGHWGCDLIKIQLMDHIRSPCLDKSIMVALLKCSRCKAFGGAHMYSLFKPITCRHPLELMVADYLAVPKCKGGFMEISLYMDVYSQQVWGFKHKSHGMAKTTTSSLSHICHEFQPPETLMTDRGSPFNNKEVKRNVGRRTLSCRSLWQCHPGLTGSLKAQMARYLDASNSYAHLTWAKMGGQRSHPSRISPRTGQITSTK